MLFISLPSAFPVIDLYHSISWNFFEFFYLSLTFYKCLYWTHKFKRNSPHDYCRCLQMNSLVLNTQQDYPHVGEPRINSACIWSINGLEHHLSHLISELFGLTQWRPFIVTSIHVIPVHLINTYSKHFFQFRIDPLLDDAVVKEFIDIEGCSMSKIEDEWMSKGFSSNVIGLFCLQ
jgi:hypothetical protein